MEGGGVFMTHTVQITDIGKSQIIQDFKNKQYNKKFIGPLIPE